MMRQAFVVADALETIMSSMEQASPGEQKLQSSGCEAISAIVAALPEQWTVLHTRVLRAGTHTSVARALRW